MSAEITVEALIKIGLDKEQAAKLFAGIRDLQSGMDSARQKADALKKKFNEMAEQGAKLREVGSIMAGAGATLLAVPTVLAQQYATAFKGLEQTANRYNDAIQKQTAANYMLGRTAAGVLIPQLEKTAEITEKIANFANAHPDLLKAGLNVGAVLAAGGGALAAVGTIQSIAGRINQLAAGGGIAGGLTQAIVYVGALGVAAKGTEALLQQFGKATGNAALANFDLGKALRQALGTAVLALANAFVEAKKSAQEMASVLGAGFTMFKTKLEGAADLLATGFRKAVIMFEGVIQSVKEGFVNFLNGLIDWANSILPSGSKIGKLSGGRNFVEMTPEQKMAYEDEQFDKREKDRNSTILGALDGIKTAAKDINDSYNADRDNLKKLADFITNFIPNGSLGPVGDQIVKTMQDLIGNAIDKLAPAQSVGASSLLNNPEAIRAFIERNKQMKKIVTEEAKAEADAKKQLDKENAEAQLKLQADIAKVEVDYLAESAKANADFRANELKEDERSAKERAHKVRDLNDQLNGLAASRDVAAFVAAKKQGEQQLRDYDEQQADAKKQRAEQFAEQRKEARARADQQIKDLKDNAAKERSARQTAYNDQISALRQHLAEQKRAIDEGFAEQLASLQGNIAGLGDMQAKIFAEQGKAFDQFIQQQGPYLRSLLGNLYGGLGGTTTSYNTTVPSYVGVGASDPRVSQISSGQLSVVDYYRNIYNNAQTQQQSRTNVLAKKLGVPGYEGGSEYIAFDHLAMVHKGDRIKGAHVPDAPSGGGAVIQVQIINPIGATEIEERAKAGALQGYLTASKLAREANGG